MFAQLKLVMGKKNSLKNTCEGVILEVNHSMHKYFISYSDPVTLKNKSRRCYLSNERRRKWPAAKGKEWQWETKWHSHRPWSRFPGQPVKPARTDNASLLETSIDQIFSSEKLNGDTVNLYFDFLWNNRVFGGGNWRFASSYFYPSLHQPVETSTYSKHIGNNSLWEYEQLMVPVHLPTENHWLLVLIGVLNLCLYIYDSARATYRKISDTIRGIYWKRTSVAFWRGQNSLPGK